MKYLLRFLYIPLKLTAFYILEWIATILVAGILPFIWDGKWDQYNDFRKITWMFWKELQHTSSDHQFDRPYTYESLKDWIFDKRTKAY